jgi:dihydropteroate synthase
MSLKHDRPLVMGILNVTPDSFSDGGEHFNAEAAIEFGLKMIADGADVIDVGGESTRPGAEAVPLEEEMRRILPVVTALCSRGARVSIDTSKAIVADTCLHLGAWMVNDVTAFSDQGMAEVCASAGCEVCLMHMLGTPPTMQDAPSYVDVVADVRDFLLGKAHLAEAAGVARQRVWIDPGIGFGKSVEHNLTLLKRLDVLVESGYKVLIGVSRKSFLGKVGAETLPVEERLEGTLSAQTWAQAKGVHAIRTHDVRAARRGIDIAAAIMGSGA